MQLCRHPDALPAQLLLFLHHLESGAHYVRVLSGTCALNNSVKRDSPLTLSLSLELLGLP